MRLRYLVVVLIVIIAILGYIFKDHLFHSEKSPLINIAVEVKTVNKTFSPSLQVFKEDGNYLERYIDGLNICYKTFGGNLSCVINKSSLLNVSYIDIQVFESEGLDKYYDTSFDISCYTSKGGKLSCLQK